MRQLISPASATPVMGERGPVQAVSRPPASRLEMDVEPPRRPAPPPRWDGRGRRSVNPAHHSPACGDRNSASRSCLKCPVIQTLTFQATVSQCPASASEPRAGGLCAGGQTLCAPVASEFAGDQASDDNGTCGGEHGRQPKRDHRSRRDRVHQRRECRGQRRLIGRAPVQVRAADGSDIHSSSNR